jgi:hypothetical protein
LAYPLFNRVFALPIVAWLFSLSVSALLLFDGTNAHIPTWLSILSKLAVMGSFILVAGYQAVLFKRDPVIRKVAGLVCAALILSVFGDIVNLNLSESYYRHGEYIKHDYLVDSIWFFMPAYLCYCVAFGVWLRYQGVRLKALVLSCLVAGSVGLISYLGMFNPNAGSYVVSLSALYSMVIALPLAFAFSLLSWAKSFARFSRVLLATGLLLATLADAVIGQFWLFTDDVAQFYPAVREWNWLLYCTSQAILTCLPVLICVQCHGVKPKVATA